MQEKPGMPVHIAAATEQETHTHTHICATLPAVMSMAGHALPLSGLPQTLSLTVTFCTVIGTPGSSLRATARTVLTAGRAAATAAGFLCPCGLLPLRLRLLPVAAGLLTTTVTPAMLIGSQAAALREC
jgi:hypothetical protein